MEATNRTINPYGKSTISFNTTADWWKHRDSRIVLATVRRWNRSIEPLIHLDKTVRTSHEWLEKTDSPSRYGTISFKNNEIVQSFLL